MTAPFILPVLTIFLLAANSTAFLLFLSDKKRAKKGVWRIPEGKLLWFAALGPFGAFVAMQLFRHKTKKGKFLLVPAFLAFQVVALLWFLVHSR